MYFAVKGELKIKSESLIEKAKALVCTVRRWMGFIRYRINLSALLALLGGRGG